MSNYTYEVKADLSNGTGHAWITLTDGSTGQTYTYGYYPAEGSKGFFDVPGEVKTTDDQTHDLNSPTLWTSGPKPITAEQFNDMRGYAEGVTADPNKSYDLIPGKAPVLDIGPNGILVPRLADDTDPNLSGMNCAKFIDNMLDAGSVVPSVDIWAWPGELPLRYPDWLEKQVLDGLMDFGKWLGEFFKPLDNAIADLYTAAQKFFLRFDPLTLDLDGDGLETVGIDPNAPILFDHNADGIKTGTGWVKPDDGMLVMDRNGNGTIDTGRELFGDSTMKSNGQLATDGFDALADLDSNGDGKISSADAQFASLRVWRDLNQDGISQSGELFTLASLGIASISTAQTANSQTLPNENQIADLGQYTRTDGSIGVTGEVSGSLGDMSGRVAAQQRGTHRPAPCGCNLAADTFHREFTDTLDTSAVSALFDMQACPERSRRGRGWVRDLREAANDREWKGVA